MSVQAVSEAGERASSGHGARTRPSTRSSRRSPPRSTSTGCCGGIVDIATDATGCHACFIYFLEGERLVLRAASPRYSEFVGKLGLGVDEGLAGWVARTKTPEFIRENAMADPRMKYVPELEEERFQSIVAVPILAKAGDVIGVVVLHTAAPREFDDDVLNFLVHTASLVAGAIENAQLYEETRRRVQALTTLTELSQALAAVTLREDLYDAVTQGARELLRADACQIYRLDVEADELVLVGSDPEGAPAPSPRPGGDGARARPDAPRRVAAAAMGAGWSRARCGRTLDEDALLVAPLVGPRRAARGALLPRRRPAVHRRGRGAARRGRQPDRRRAEEGRADRAADGGEHRQGHVRRAGRGLGGGRGGEGERGGLRPQPAPPLPARRARAACRRCRRRPGRSSRPGSRRACGGSIREPSSTPATTGCGRWRRCRTEQDAAVERLRAACEPLGREEGLVVGLSDVDRGAASARRRMREAADAARIGRSLVAEGGAVSYEQLGAYRYLVHLELDEAPRDRYRPGGGEAGRVRPPARRPAGRDPGAVPRRSRQRDASARALYVHPNTVRQRLERIERVAGLDLPNEDLLSLELALKLVRLHRVRAEKE